MSELTNQEPKELVNVTESMFDPDSGITMEDITIGRISIQQSMSELVQNDLAKVGDIVNLMDNTIIGGKDTSFEFIPISSFKYWIEKDGDDFIGRYPALNPNEKPWNEGTIKRVFHHSFYALLVNDLQDGFAMPVEIPFRSTDLASARKLSSFIVKLWMRKLPIYGKVFKINSMIKKKDKYTWYVSNITEGRETTAIERNLAKVWANTLKTNSTIKHTEADVEPAFMEDNNVQSSDDLMF